MCVCTCVCVPVPMYMCVHVHLYVCVHEPVYVCVHLCVWVCTCVHVSVHVYLCACVHEPLCVHVHLCARVCSTSLTADSAVVDGCHCVLKITQGGGGQAEKTTWVTHPPHLGLAPDTDVRPQPVSLHVCLCQLDSVVL